MNEIVDSSRSQSWAPVVVSFYARLLLTCRLNVIFAA